MDKIENFIEIRTDEMGEKHNWKGKQIIMIYLQKDT